MTHTVTRTIVPLLDANGCARLPIRLTELAEAVTADPKWNELPTDRRLVVRQGTRPFLAAVGRFEQEDRSRLLALRGAIHSHLFDAKVLSYDDVERACASLATALRTSIGEDRLAGAHFTAVPRGGLIVLGMLSYLLEIRPEQLSPPTRPVDLLVVIDDCILSGNRMWRYLRSSEHATIAIGTLYAAEQAKSGLLEREPRVIACESGESLRDLAPERHGQEYEAWRARWTARTADTAYWVGETAHVCFPWNEPDIGVWNEAAGRAERGWRLVPPSRCLKYRANEAAETEIVVLREPASGRLAPADDVLWLDDGAELVIGSAGTRSLLTFDGSAVETWRALLESGTIDGALEALTATYDAPRASLERGVGAFVDTLSRRGLLTWTS